MRFQRVLADAHAPADFSQLPKRLSADGGLHAHLRADGRAIGHSADALDLEPIVVVGVVVIQGVVFGADDPAVRYEQIQETVVVIVPPRGAGAKPAIGDDAAGGDLLEGTAAAIQVEPASLITVNRNEKIWSSVVIDVCPSGVEAALRGSAEQIVGDAREGSVRIIVIEPVDSKPDHEQV